MDERTTDEQPSSPSTVDSVALQGEVSPSLLSTTIDNYMQLGGLSPAVALIRIRIPNYDEEPHLSC